MHYGADDEGQLPSLEKACGDKQKLTQHPLLRRYFMQTVRLAMSDFQVRTGLAVVNHMVEAPSALFKPVIASKVLLLAIQDAFAKLRNGLQSKSVQEA